MNFFGAKFYTWNCGKFEAGKFVSYYCRHYVMFEDERCGALLKFAIIKSSNGDLQPDTNQLEDYRLHDKFCEYYKTNKILTEILKYGTDLSQFFKNSRSIKRRAKRRKSQSHSEDQTKNEIQNEKNEIQNEKNEIQNEKNEIQNEIQNEKNEDICKESLDVFNKYLSILMKYPLDKIEDKKDAKKKLSKISKKVQIIRENLNSEDDTEDDETELSRSDSMKVNLNSIDIEENRPENSSVTIEPVSLADHLNLNKNNRYESIKKVNEIDLNSSNSSIDSLMDLVYSFKNVNTPLRSDPSSSSFDPSIDSINSSKNVNTPVECKDQEYEIITID